MFLGIIVSAFTVVCAAAADSQPTAGGTTMTYANYLGSAEALVPSWQQPFKKTLARAYSSSEEVFWEAEHTDRTSTPNKSCRLYIYVYRYFPDARFPQDAVMQARLWRESLVSAFCKTLGHYDDSRGVGRGDFANKDSYRVTPIAQRWPQEIIVDYPSAYETKLTAPDYDKRLKDNYHFTEFEVHGAKQGDSEAFNCFALHAGNVAIYAFSKSWNMPPPRMRPIVEAMTSRLPRNGAQEAPSPFKLTFEPAQVLDFKYCRTWIKDKSAVLRAKLKWEDPKVKEVQAKVEFTCNGRPVDTAGWGMNLPANGLFTFHAFFAAEESARKHRLSQDSANAIFVPNQPGANQLEVTVTPLATDGRPCAPLQPLKTNCTVNVVASPRTLRLYFTAIAVGEWQSQTQMDPQAFQDLRQAQLEFLLGVLPLPYSQLKDVNNSPVMLKPDNVLGEKITGQTRLGLLARLQSLHKPGEVDYAIGFVPASWLGDIGITEPDRFPNAMLLGVGQSYEPALAHELLHLLGFKHFPGRTIDSSESSGAYVKNATQFFRKDVIWGQTGNKGLTELMNADIDHAESMWILKNHYAQLLKIFGVFP